MNLTCGKKNQTEPLRLSPASYFSMYKIFREAITKLIEFSHLSNCLNTIMLQYELVNLSNIKTMVVVILEQKQSPSYSKLSTNGKLYKQNEYTQGSNKLK